MRQLSLRQWLAQIHGSPLYMARRMTERVAHELRKYFITLISTLFFRVRCRVFGFRCGSKLEVYGWVDIRGPASTIEIGRGVQLISSSWRCMAASLSQPVRLRTFTRTAGIVLADGSSLNGTSITARSRRVSIGRNVLIAPDCMIVDSDFHDPWPPEGRKSNPGLERDADVSIGDNVWIGARSIILKGVVIGENALVGAGSVVTHSVPPNTLVAGNPARIVKTYTEAAPVESGI